METYNYKQMRELAYKPRSFTPELKINLMESVKNLTKEELNKLNIHFQNTIEVHGNLLDMFEERGTIFRIFAEYVEVENRLRKEGFATA